MTPIELLKNRLGEKDPEYLGYILWNCTAFPFNRTYKWARQAIQFKWYANQGWSVCMRCGGPYKHDSGKIWMDAICEQCHKEFTQR